MTLDSKFHCNGSCVVGDRKFGCWRTSGHGSENFTQAFINSCNPAFIKIGASLGSNLFFRYFSLYGLTERTKIDLPGETDSIYVKEKDFTPVSLASESFGQTESITAMQMVSAFNAVVNGGYLHTPHVVNQILDSNGNVLQTIGANTKRQVISETTSSTMRGILEGVVKGIDGKGTNASIPGYRIIGKSGTGQKLKHMQQTGQRTYVSSFVGAIPAEKPQYSLMVLIDTPTDGTYYGGTIASPVFGVCLKTTPPVPTTSTFLKLDRSSFPLASSTDSPSQAGTMAEICSNSSCVYSGDIPRYGAASRIILAKTGLAIVPP